MKRIIPALLLTLWTCPLFADVLATGTGLAVLQEDEPFTCRLTCRADRARWDFSGKQYLEGTVLYRGDLGVFWAVDTVQKTYFELPALGPGEEDMRVGILAVLYAVARKTLPAAKRAELDEGVARMPVPEHLLDFRKKGAVQSGRWKCDRYEVFLGTTKCGEYLTAGAKTLGLSTADYGAMEGAWKAGMSLYGHFDFLFPEPAAGNRGSYQGFPVTWAFEKDGKSTFSLQFKTIGTQKVPDSTYDLPAGLKKVEVFDLLMQ